MTERQRPDDKQSPGTVLVVAAHPDDEVLGCGGTLARHAAAGQRVEIVILAEGATSRGDERRLDSQQSQIEALQNAARKAANVLGACPPHFVGLPDNRLDGVYLLDVVKHVERFVADLAPAVVYTHHPGDLNIDHQITHQAVLTACRPVPGCPVQAIYAFETVSATEYSCARASDHFTARRFVDVQEHWHQKIRALDAYASEMRSFPHARSVEALQALATWRGASVGIPKAEAFDILRQVDHDNAR